MSAKTEVYNFISEMVTKGKLKRNEHITEKYLTQNLQMSRTPIREALLQLCNDNVLVHEPRKGYRIKTYTKQEVGEIYTIIGLLDGKAAELAMPLLSKDDFKMMEFFIDSMNSAIQHSLYTEYNTLQAKFHDVYLKKCSNKALVNELNKMKDLFIGKNYEHMSPKNIKPILKKTNSEHQKILDLFKANDATKLRNYIENVHWRPSAAQYDIW